MNEDLDLQDVIENPAEEIEETPEPDSETPVEEPADEGEKSLTDAEKDAKIAELEAKNQKLYARIKREKGKSDGGTKVKAEDQPDALSRDEAILFAKGLDAEDVEKAKTIAAIEGISLDKAATSEYFTTYKRAKEKKVELEKAQLGASKGARTSVKKTFDTPDLSDEDHRALFREQNG